MTEAAQHWPRWAYFLDSPNVWSGQQGHLRFVANERPCTSAHTHKISFSQLWQPLISSFHNKFMRVPLHRAGFIGRDF